MAKKKKTPTQKAYQVAGHTAMYYLLSKGLAMKYAPVGKDGMLVPIETISRDMNSRIWDEITTNLGSIVTSAQLLMAGHAAEYHYLMTLDNLPKKPSKYQGSLMSRAFLSLDGYLEEYAGHSADPSEVTKHARKWGKEVYAYIEEEFEAYWEQIDALAAQLEQTESMSMSDAFEILEKPTQ